MSIEIHSVQRLRAFVEATFGADSSGSIGSFTDIPAIEGSATVTLTRDELDPGQLVQHIDEGRERVLGKRKAVLSFSVNIAPTGTAAVNGVTSITSGLGLLLKAVMGGEQLAEGSVSAAGSTATAVNVSPGDSGQWTAGRAMGWVNAAGVLEVREVESVADPVVTLKRAFSGAPATSDVLYNAATYYMTANPSTSLAMAVEGLESDDRWLLTGGQAEGGMSLAIDLTGGALPKATFNFTFARWYSSSETASSLTGALGTATYSAFSPIVGEAGMYEVWVNGTSTYTAATQLIPVSAVSFDPHCTFVGVTSPSGVNTVKQWTKARNPDSPVMGQFTTPYEGLTWFDHRNSKTDLGVMYVAGVAGGSTVALSAPTVQVLNPQRIADAGGIAAQTVDWKGRRDSDVGGSTTDLAKSPFRIHLL